MAVFVCVCLFCVIGTRSACMGRSRPLEVLVLPLCSLFSRFSADENSGHVTKSSSHYRTHAEREKERRNLPHLGSNARIGVFFQDSRLDKLVTAPYLLLIASSPVPADVHNSCSPSRDSVPLSGTRTERRYPLGPLTRSTTTLGVPDESKSSSQDRPAGDCFLLLSLSSECWLLRYRTVRPYDEAAFLPGG